MQMLTRLFEVCTMTIVAALAARTSSDDVDNARQRLAGLLYTRVYL